MRNKYKEAIYQLMKDDSRIIAILVDSGTEEYDDVRRDFSGRIVECGIAEANAVGVAAGIASCGYIPVIYGMGAFLAYRAFEFIRNDVCLQNRNVKIVGSGGGIGYNNLGPTHHTTEDIAVMTSLPNMTVLAPATPLEVAPVMMAAVSYIGPVYIRFGKAFEEEIYQEEPIIEIGKANIIREGKDLTIIVTGSMISDVVKSTELLEQEGIDTEVLNMTTLKPIDKEAIIKSAAKTGRILTVEEHNYYGGLRSLVSDALIDTGRRVEFQSICFQDEFCMQYGWRQNIRKMYGISVDGILETARKMMV
ncbi:MAG: transketolase [Lachnospiraceae bacterium]|nr:transketolase [Lachnospiraceae bacterium]